MLNQNNQAGPVFIGPNGEMQAFTRVQITEGVEAYVRVEDVYVYRSK